LSSSKSIADLLVSSFLFGFSIQGEAGPEVHHVEHWFQGGELRSPIIEDTKIREKV